MLLEDRYREAIRNNEPGWDDTLEPLKCPQTDAYRRKFEEDQEKMRVQQMEDELRAKINAENKRASEQAAREALPSTSGLAAPTGMASLNEDEMQLVRQSLIIQIETLTKDPAAMSDEVFKMLLREKKRLQDGFAPAPYIKKEVERRMDDLRKSRRTESDVLQALRSFKRDEGFIRPRSPPHRERSRGHSREHERVSERRSERSREHSRERTRDYHSERSRERSRDRDYRGGRGWVRHGDEVTEMSIQRKIDTTKLLAATREREEKRRAETFRTEPEKEGHQVPTEVAFRNRNVRMSTPERSWDKRREHTRNRTPDPRDKRWQQRAAFYATFDSGASKRSSSAEREDTPPKYQRMESTVHVVDPIVSTVQEDDAMEGTGSVVETTSQENVTHRRNVILDSDLQPASSTSNEPSQPASADRRELEGQGEPDNRRQGDQRLNSRFNNRQPESIDMEYKTTDIDEQTVEICRYFGLEPDSVEANKIGTILRQLSHFLLDSGYAKEIKEGVEQGLFRRLFIHRDSVRDCYLPIRQNGLHSLVDLNLLDVPLDTTDPIGMTQFYYRDYPERQEYVAQFVLRYVNPAFKLLAARASVGLQVDPKDYAAKRMGQKVFAARLAHYKTQNQLVSNTMRDDIPPFFRPHVAKLGQPLEHISIAHNARKALKKCKTRMEKGNLTQRHASQVEERINKIKDSLGSD
ncbi:serine/threonine-protein kinase fray2-like [Paramacrobiotus metropolitanus]|uniref:serine/threonine-protein kinase fray2-like n=1 Tax=Paramacrobiotus metropolitanus TaxID=2943436 RepID=UPI0024461533|nr:serine/threonine-protein kinase fray2-like [Paramacrobiotus metropolitanus]XP_055348208.1 serine/threonine-protein kinase fray2-like [Paramacrobiotus metropolitanus]